MKKTLAEAGITRVISPHKLRHYLLTWLKKQGIDDSFIQPYSGHALRQSLEVYSQLSIKRRPKGIQSGNQSISSIKFRICFNVELF